MPFEPLGDDDKVWMPACQSPEHDPPSLMLFRKSGYWVCPECGHRTLIRVDRPVLGPRFCGPVSSEWWPVDIGGES